MSGTYYPCARTLWTLSSSGLGQTLTASGNSGLALISLMDITDVWLSLYVAGSPSGTSPTLSAQIDVQDPDGNWFTAVAKTSNVTAAGSGASAYAGLHMPNVSTSSAAIVLPTSCRIAWTVGGTAGPTFPQTSICLIGR